MDRNQVLRPGTAIECRGPDTRLRGRQRRAPARLAPSAVSPTRRRDMFLTRAQPLRNGQCAVAVASASVGGAEEYLGRRRVETERNRLLIRRDGFSIPALGRVGVAVEHMGVWIVSIQFTRRLQGRHRLAVPTSGRQHVANSGVDSRRERIQLPGAGDFDIRLLVAAPEPQYAAYQRCARARFGLSSMARVYSRSASAHSQPYVKRLAST